MSTIGGLHDNSPKVVAEVEEEIRAMTNPHPLGDDGVDDTEVMRIWRECGLPEYFLGNGGSNHKLVAFAERLRAVPSPKAEGWRTPAIEQRLERWYRMYLRGDRNMAVGYIFECDGKEFELRFPALPSPPVAVDGDNKE